VVDCCFEDAGDCRCSAVTKVCASYSRVLAFLSVGGRSESRISRTKPMVLWKAQILVFAAPSEEVNESCFRSRALVSRE